MRRISTSQVQDGGANGAALATDAEVRALNVRVDEHRQVRGVDAVSKIIAVDLTRVAGWVAPEVMPDHVVGDTVSHSALTEAQRVHLLVAPLEPTCLGWAAVDEDHTFNLRRIHLSEAGQDIGTSTNTKSDEILNPKVANHEEQLARQLVHGWVHIVIGQLGGTFLLAWRIHVIQGEVLSQATHFVGVEKVLEIG